MKPIKMILMGESGSGKTTALASLLKAGYNVRVLDFDNGMDALLDVSPDPKQRERLDYITMTEPMRVAGGRLVPAKASVWQKAMTTLDGWKCPDNPALTLHPGKDLGKVTTWGPRDVLVIDTLSTLGEGAKNFHMAINGKLGQVIEGNARLRDIGAAQNILETLLQYLYDTSVLCNVIVSTHVVWAKEDGTAPAQGEENPLLYGFPATIGKSFSAKAPKYFNTVVLAKKVGTIRKIYTGKQGNIGLKTSAPTKVLGEYPQETGLADIFKAIQGDLKDV